MPAGSAEHTAPRIEVLTPEVRDAIAAGEVIERPAAVVKELVENAIDAAATRITVRVTGAGRDTIEVVDDGHGILKEDLTLAVRRHATSKLRAIADLSHVLTLGFRGEALASVAAVSEVEVITRTRDGGEGRRMRVRGGTTLEEGAAASPRGTRVEVRELFFNTPARLQFLKQPLTENAAIGRVVADLALANPAIAIQLTMDGREALATAGDGDLRGVLAAIYDAETAAAMLAVDQDGVTGLLAPPSLHRATRDHVVLMVNGRRIHHRNLAYAVDQAYRGLREPDRFPIAVLNVQVDPSEVDVNVHPTKREVRFRHEGAVFIRVERACFHALRASPLYALAATPQGLQLRESALLSGPATTASLALPTREEAVAPVASRPAFPALRFSAQALNAYLLAEAAGALVLVDQHAAHERVIFDRIRGRMRARSPLSQLALVPIVLEVTPEQLAAFEVHQSLLHDTGFDADRFGHHALRVTGIPAELREGEGRGVFEQLLNDLAGDRPPDRRVEVMAALIACHSAVRFGDALTRPAAEELLSSLASTDEPITCPHGRPTTLVLPDEQLRRLFRRP